jgi:DtxR family Mn-dependent transcriptional regulator
MVTLSEENYLKAIFHLGQEGKEAVSTNAIADKIEAKASSVTDMVKKLAEKNLANYVKYQGVTLTQQGRKAATSVVRKHRLWEVFLVEKLHFKWDEVHEVAEQLEHVKSAKLIQELDAFLGFPTHDPHGDPIPDSEGNLSPVVSSNILEVPKGTKGILVQVKDSSDVFLKYLNKNGLSIGVQITVGALEPFDQSLLISFEGKSLTISNVVAQNLLIQKIA